MVQLFVYILKALLVVFAVGLIGMHYLLKPVSPELKTAALVILFIMALLTLARNQTDSQQLK